MKIRRADVACACSKALIGPKSWWAWVGVGREGGRTCWNAIQSINSQNQTAAFEGATERSHHVLLRKPILIVCDTNQLSLAFTQANSQQELGGWDDGMMSVAITFFNNEESGPGRDPYGPHQRGKEAWFGRHACLNSRHGPISPHCAISFFDPIVSGNEAVRPSTRHVDSGSGAWKIQWSLPEFSDLLQLATWERRVNRVTLYGLRYVTALQCLQQW